jgi:hypothetical protein
MARKEECDERRGLGRQNPTWWVHGKDSPGPGVGWSCCARNRSSALLEVQMREEADSGG